MWSYCSCCRRRWWWWWCRTSEQCFFWLCGPYTLGDIPMRSLRGVKGSLRGGVLFGVAYAGGYARIIVSANLKKSALRQLWLQGHQIPQKSQSLIFENIIWENPLTQVCLRNDLSSTDTQSAYAAYATMRILRYCAYALFVQFPFLHIPFI